MIELKRRRRNNDTEPNALAVSSEMAVLRAMARNERQLEMVINGQRDLGERVERQLMLLVSAQQQLGERIDRQMALVVEGLREGHRSVLHMSRTVAIGMGACVVAALFACLVVAVRR